jgi:hypothetical protein
MTKLNCLPGDTRQIVLTPSISLLGDYVKNELNEWVSTSTTARLLIATRSKVTQSKSNFFLLHIDENNRRTYVSSLYPTATGYKFDYLGLKYSLQRSKGLCISIALLRQKMSQE